MSVDIKSLRIGSHVEFKGERVKVVRVEAMDNHAEIMCERNPDDYVRAGYVNIKSDRINGMNPIPIAEELLSELGFEYLRGEYLREDMNIANYIDDLWYVNFNVDDAQSMGMIRYLHELEAMYYHVFNKELIEE